MKGLLIGLIVLLSALSCVAPAAAEAPLVFGVLNQQSPALTAERWNPILHYVTSVTGIPLVLKMGADGERHQRDDGQGRVRPDVHESQFPVGVRRPGLSRDRALGG